MGSIYNLFETDKNLETSGIYIEYFSDESETPIRFKVARAGGSNKKYMKMVNQFAKRDRVSLEGKSSSSTNKKLDKVIKEAFVHSVLLGWENVTDKEGNELKYTPENALRLFEDLPDLFQDLAKCAADAEYFRTEKEIEEDLGNSGAASDTGSSKDPTKRK